MRGARPFLLLTSVACCFIARSARADDGTIAEALFRAGREAMTRGDYVVACDRFGESQRLDPAPGTLLNLGECSEKLGRLASAWRAYVEAGDRLAAGDPRQTFARNKVDELAPRLPRVRVLLSPEAAGCTVAIAGTKLGPSTLDQALPVDPGSFDVELSCEGRAPTHTAVAASESRTVEVSLRPGPPLETPAAVAPAPPAPVAGPSGLAIAGWITGGVGLASLGVGAVLGGLAIDRKSTMDASCTEDDPPRCTPAGVDAAAEGEAFATGSTATIAVGAALAAVGATLLVVDATSDSPDETTATLRLGPGHLVLHVTF
ncbi:MAG: hypothetical protein JNL21_16810 [Myxococcales bacterium]|nr:hypothetical protein [Myxococcales bacterium]